MLSPLGQQLIELIKKDYQDDYARACHLARAIEGECGSPEEALHKRLRVYRRYDLAAFTDDRVGELNKLWKKSISAFCDLIRDQMVGRRRGHPEREQIPPELVRLDTLRFCPDEIISRDGVAYIEVRVGPAAPIAIPTQQASAPVELGRKPGPDWSTDLKRRVSDVGLAIMRDSEKRPVDGRGQLMALARQIVRDLGLPHESDSIRRMSRGGELPELSAMIPTARKQRKRRKRKAKQP